MNLTLPLWQLGDANIKKPTTRGRFFQNFASNVAQAINTVQAINYLLL